MKERRKEREQEIEKLRKANAALSKSKDKEIEERKERIEKLKEENEALLKRKDDIIEAQKAAEEKVLEDMKRGAKAWVEESRTGYEETLANVAASPDAAM